MDDPGQLARVDLELEPLLSVDLDHRDPDAVLALQVLVVLDVNLLQLERMILLFGDQDPTGLVTEVTTGPGVQDYVHRPMVSAIGRLPGG